MKRLCKIISFCLQYRKYMSLLDQNNPTEIQKVIGKDEDLQGLLLVVSFIKPTTISSSGK